MRVLVRGVLVLAIESPAATSSQDIEEDGDGSYVLLDVRGERVRTANDGKNDESGRMNWDRVEGGSEEEQKDVARAKEDADTMHLTGFHGESNQESEDWHHGSKEEASQKFGKSTELTYGLL